MAMIEELKEITNGIYVLTVRHGGSATACLLLG